MKAIKVENIPSEGLIIDFLVDQARLEEISVESPLGFIPAGPLEVQGELIKSGSDILFEGKIKGSIGLSCGRCLEPFWETLEVPVRSEWRIVAPRAKTSVKDGVSQIEDLETGLIKEGILDLEDRILEEVILSIPILPLCRENCLGLCTICGENRNIKPCTCKSHSGTNPFAVLKDLKV